MVVKGRKLLGSPPVHFKQLFSNISTLQSSDKFTDVIFQCSGGQVAAHKAMLIPLSPLLKILFEVSSSKQSSDVTIISLAEVDVGPVKGMISCIYNGNSDSFNRKKRDRIQQVATLLQVRLQFSGETQDEVTPTKTEGRKKKKPIILSSPSIPVEIVASTRDNSDEEYPSTSNGKAKRKSRKSSEVVMELDDNVSLDEVISKSPPRRLGGFRSFDYRQIQEAIMENAKTRAETDMMQVGLLNVSKDKNKKTEKFYNSAIETINEHEDAIHESIVEESSFNLDKEDEEANKSIETSENDDELDEYEVEEIIDKREINGKDEYFVKWKGWEDAGDRTWEPVDNLESAGKLILEYELKQAGVKSATKKMSSREVLQSNGKPDADDEVEQILDKKGTGRKVNYLVKWKNFDKEDDQTWEPLENLTEASEIIERFEKELLTKHKEKETPPQSKEKSKSNGSADIEMISSDEDDEESDYEVEKILEVRQGKSGKEYLVKWKGWEKKEDRTWEPEDSLGGSRQLLTEFEAETTKDNEELEIGNVSGDDLQPLFRKSKQIRKIRNKAKGQKDVEGGSEGDDYEVEQILDHKEEGGVFQYLVKWKNWDKEGDNTWEPSDNLDGSEDIIDKYKKQLLVMNKKEQRNSVRSLDDLKLKKSTIISDDDDEDEDQEYEVEQIVDRRTVEDVTEYLVKWKGWEDEGDKTWEPEANLQGSEKLIENFESGLKSNTEISITQSAEDGVVLCKDCNRIFLSCDALRSHEKDIHKKTAISSKIEVSAKRKRSSLDSGNLDCYNCGIECKSRHDLKNHVLTHFYADFYSLLPASKPFTCPTCSLESRDRITLVRHFAFTHKEIYKYCSHVQLTNSTTDDTALDNEKNNEASSSDLSPQYKPGPKSKKKKTVAMSDDQGAECDSVSPVVASKKRSSAKIGKVQRASCSGVDLTDSSDEDNPEESRKESKSFDILFSESKTTLKKSVDRAKPVFNKDSDDESDQEKTHANVDDLMGVSDDDKSKDCDG